MYFKFLKHKWWNIKKLLTPGERENIGRHIHVYGQRTNTTNAFCLEMLVNDVL